MSSLEEKVVSFQAEYDRLFKEVSSLRTEKATLARQTVKDFESSIESLESRKHELECIVYDLEVKQQEKVNEMAQINAKGLTDYKALENQLIQDMDAKKKELATVIEKEQEAYRLRQQEHEETMKDFKEKTKLAEDKAKEYEDKISTLHNYEHDIAERYNLLKNEENILQNKIDEEMNKIDNKKNNIEQLSKQSQQYFNDVKKKLNEVNEIIKQKECVEEDAKKNSDARLKIEEDKKIINRMKAENIAEKRRLMMEKEKLESENVKMAQREKDVEVAEASIAERL